MKVRYVQLEADAFLKDVEFLLMTPAEKGLYCLILFLLYSNQGFYELDAKKISKLCNCDVERFDEIWQQISYKFRIKKDRIYHKKVSKEIRKVKKRLQAQRKAALRTNEKRWVTDRQPSRLASYNEKGNENENVKDNNITNTNGSNTLRHRKSSLVSSSINSISSSSFSSRESPGNCPQAIGAIAQSSISRLKKDEPKEPAEDSLSQEPAVDIEKKALEFLDALNKTIPPRTKSDRTCYRKVTQWLVEGCRLGKFNTEFFLKVLEMAELSRGGANPQALFMSMITKLDGYRAKKTDIT